MSQMEPVLNRYESCQRIYMKPPYITWNTQMNSVKERHARKLLFQTPKATYAVVPFCDILEEAKP